METAEEFIERARRAGKLDMIREGLARHAEAPTWKGGSIYKDTPFDDQYQGLIDGEWVNVEQVRVIRRPVNASEVSIRVGVLTWPGGDDSV